MGALTGLKRLLVCLAVHIQLAFTRAVSRGGAGVRIAPPFRQKYPPEPPPPPRLTWQAVPGMGLGPRATLGNPGHYCDLRILTLGCDLRVED